MKLAELAELYERKLMKLARLVKLYVRKLMPWWIRVAYGTFERKWSGKEGAPEQGGPAQSPLD